MSTSLWELPCLKELKAENSVKIDSSTVNKLKEQLVIELEKTQNELESAKVINLPKIEKFKKEKEEIKSEIKSIKKEIDELNEIKPLTILEKRRNDFKTEGEYINKILSRNIQEEFVNQMKRELKLVINSSIESADSLDQIISGVPGCDEINEKLDEKGVEGLAISQKTEKILSLISKCNREVLTKVYPKDSEKCDSFKQFSCNLLKDYFQKRVGKKGSSPITLLPQFVALLLNDLIITITFIKVHYSKARSFIPVIVESLQEMRQNVYENFLKEQREEISDLFEENDVSQLMKNMKKLSIFLNRLEKVLSSTMLKTDLINLKSILINFVHKLVWERLRETRDIAEDEIEDLIQLIETTLTLTTASPLIESTLIFKPKLKEILNLLRSSLIEIINTYHRREYKSLTWWELEGFICSIYASSPLRNEFIKEIRLSEDSFVDENEEYF